MAIQKVAIRMAYARNAMQLIIKNTTTIIKKSIMRLLEHGGKLILKELGRYKENAA